MNTANKFTMLRVALIPVFLAILYIGFEYSSYAAMGVFIIASVTDFIDGYIARSRDQVTNFGKFMDPIADKVLTFAAMLWFIEQGALPAWIVLIVLIREFMVTALRLIAVEGGRVIAAGLLGKVKTVCTMVCLTVMFLPLPEVVGYICTAVIAVTTVVSGAEYFVKNRDIINWDK